MPSLQEKTGGKIIYRRGGIVYLFRGRNYNYKTRPRFPLMLWKPVTPVYPRLVKRVPEGLALEEATDMRKRGCDLTPICKLGKNGVYVNLVKDVREAFEACELVRINCQGLNPSDYRKIGAKLKDLVPCVLISFEYEHILMWRGRDWKSSLVLPVDGSMGEKTSETDYASFLTSSDPSSLASENEERSALCSSSVSRRGTSVEMPNFSTDLIENSDQDVNEDEEISSQRNDILYEVDGLISSQSSTLGSETMSEFGNYFDLVESIIHTRKTETITVDSLSDEEVPTYASLQSDSMLDVDDVDDNESAPGNYSDVSAVHDTLETMSENSQESSPPSASPSTEGVLFLLRQAVEDGSAVILDRSCLDADVVYQRSVAFAQVAPPGPVFRYRPRKIAIQKSEKKENGDLVVDKAVPVPEKKSNEKKSKEKKSSRTQSHRAKDIKEDHLNVVPQGSLKVDELAKLLA